MSDKKYLDGGAYPLSVADMEFSTAPEIIEAIKSFAQKGFFCYTGVDEEYRSTVKAFMKKHHDWDIDEDDIICTGGVVSALNTAVRAFTNEGDRVIIQRPVYYPFSDAVNNNHRKIVNNPLIRCGNTYKMNFEELDRLASDKNTKLMILCSPHNPVGRVWDREELLKVGEICKKHGLILVSDEIHFDLVNKPHTVFNNADSSFRDFTVICTAVSKSYNLAGLGTSNIIIQNKKLRDTFQTQLTADGYSCINCLSRPATIAAYTECDEWLKEVNGIINNNFSLLSAYLEKELPEAIIMKREGTYLAWIDLNFLGMSDEELNRFLPEQCKVIPDPGFWFGDEGKGFTRLNLAVPEKILMQSAKSLCEAIKLYRRK